MQAQEPANPTSDRSVLGRFLDWWLTTLADAMPGAIRRAAKLEREPLLLHLSGDRLEVEAGRGNRKRRIASVSMGPGERVDRDAILERALGRIDPSESRVVLSLDPEHALTRRLKLPRAAEPELASALEFEVERHTPFRADQVYYFYEVDRAESDADRIAVELVVMPRRIVDPLIRELTAYGLAPEAVTVAGRPLSSAALGPSLTHGSRLASGEAGRRLPVMSLLILMVAFAAAAASPLLRLKYAATELTAAVAAAESDLAENRALQDEADRLTRAVQVIAKAKSETPSPIRILNVLSTVLPDDTFLVQLDISGREMVLEGKTAASATIVGLIETAPLFGAVTYRTPVTREGGFERFNFAVELGAGP